MTPVFRIPRSQPRRPHWRQRQSPHRRQRTLKELPQKGSLPPLCLRIVQRDVGWVHHLQLFSEHGKEVSIEAVGYVPRTQAAC